MLPDVAFVGDDGCHGNRQANKQTKKETVQLFKST